MNYNEAIQYIHGTHKFGIKLGLDNIKYLLELLDNPQDKLKFVHVAGTNGKGSTVAFISSILGTADYKVGIFTSPYIERFTERIKINEDEISESDLAEITNKVKAKVDLMTKRGYNHPTEFEIVTAIAFMYFNQKKCDIVVLEVGLGGRFDSTNVIKSPLVSVITSISFDHMNILGDTLDKIAYEKAGIIKEKSDVVLYPQEVIVENVIKDACVKSGSNLYIANFNEIEKLEYDLDGQAFNYKSFKNLQISLLGEHQINNAVIAAEAVNLLKDKGFNISSDAIRKGFKNARWNGRFEILRKDPVFIIDGAHNVDGVKMMIKTLDKYFPRKEIVFIIGMLKDKDFKAIIETVSKIAKYFIVITPENERALPAKELALVIKNYCNNVSISDTIETAINLSLKISSKDDVICSFGSLYYIGDVRKILKKYKNICC